jgi:lipopolysaccharide/colanic/teichoic acid biosynthesis glycosyltransferase
MKTVEARRSNGVPTELTDEQLAVWYNDNVLYPDKVRINRYYLHHYSFVKDIQMILCTVLGRRMEYGGEVI